jgi:hypothetical protein
MGLGYDTSVCFNPVQQLSMFEPVFRVEDKTHGFTKYFKQRASSSGRRNRCGILLSSSKQYSIACLHFLELTLSRTASISMGLVEVPRRKEGRSQSRGLGLMKASRGTVLHCMQDDGL